MNGRRFLEQLLEWLVSAMWVILCALAVVPFLIWILRERERAEALDNKVWRLSDQTDEHERVLELHHQQLRELGAAELAKPEQPAP